MIADIPIGQYYPAQSVIHRLDPRLKIAAAFAYIILAFFLKTFIGLAGMAVLLAAVTVLSGVPVSKMLKGLKTVYILLAITFVFNLLLSGGENVLVHIWVIKITREGLIRACFMAIRLVLLITGASVLTLTTTPIALTDGMERLLSPLAHIGFPAHEVAMMMTIALRFIPTLIKEADRIMCAQAARGASFDEGGLLSRAKAIVPLLVPLFVSAFRRAEELALAMEARCYHGGEGRTRMHTLAFAGRDWLALGIMVLFTAFTVADAVYISNAMPFLANV